MNRHAWLVSLVAVTLIVAAWTVLGTPGISAEPGKMGSLIQKHQKIKMAIQEGQVPVEVQAGEFTMLSFLVMSLPAQSNGDGTYNRGDIAPNPTLGTGPAVWETMKNSTEIYRAQGATPQPWATVNEFPDGVTPLTPAQLQAKYGPTNSPWLHFLSSSRMIDGQQVVDANANVLWYDVRGNQDYFNYVTVGQYPLYNLEGQEQARADANFTFDFPQDALEFKGTWRLLGPNDDDTKYWTAYGAYYDATNTLQYAKIGLTALHIISHVQSNWFWMTFEQVDNPSATFQYFLGEKGNPVGPNLTMNPLAIPINEELRLVTKGTKWQNYRVIGWQFDEVRGDGQPVVLANSNIETYFPQTSSCMSCHTMANIGPPDNRRLNMWNTNDSGIQGRIGGIDFAAIVQGMGLDPTQYKPMNYVWSLREAQSTAAPMAKAKPTSR
jgi:hypothetical protein